MNFYQTVFPEKNFLEDIHKKGGFWGNYPFWSELQIKNYDLKSRLYMPQNCGVSKKSKTI